MTKPTELRMGDMYQSGSHPLVTWLVLKDGDRCRTVAICLDGYATGNKAKVELQSKDVDLEAFRSHTYIGNILERMEGTG